MSESIRWVVDAQHPEGHAVPMTDDEIANLEAFQGGSWTPPAAGSPTLEDLAFDQDGRDLVCTGCGLTRANGDPFWRAYDLTSEQTARATLDPTPEPSYVCPDCEPRFLFGDA